MFNQSEWLKQLCSIKFTLKFFIGLGPGLSLSYNSSDVSVLAVRLTSFLLVYFGFSCFVDVELGTGLLVWLNPHQSNRRSAIPE